MIFVLLGDTHGFHPDIPDGDVLIHTGDFTQGWGGRDHVKDVAKWLGSLPHPHKFLIGGNHDGSLFAHDEQCRAILGVRGITYLCHEAAMVGDIKIWGSPYHPQFAGVFGKTRLELAALWDQIDPDTDVLITHGPPHGILDIPGSPLPPEHAGDVDLWLRVERVRPKLHAFGHIHGGYGVAKQWGVTFYNVSVCNEKYEPVNPVTVADI
jgi:calcineurin-like phosphoesterase family protein